MGSSRPPPAEADRKEKLEVSSESNVAVGCTKIALSAAVSGIVDVPMTIAEKDSSRDMVYDPMAVASPGWRLDKIVDSAIAVPGGFPVGALSGVRGIVFVLAITRKDPEVSKDIGILFIVVCRPGTIGVAILLMKIAVPEGSKMIGPIPGNVAIGFSVILATPGALGEAIVMSEGIGRSCPTGDWGGAVSSGAVIGVLENAAGAFVPVRSNGVCGSLVGAARGLLVAIGGPFGDDCEADD